MDNSRLVFVVSCAFTGPLLHLVGMESGGYHFRGDSSTGKTTVLRGSASVWGGPDFLQRWRTTDNGLEAIAAQHSDLCLIMDDLIQVDSKVAAAIVYMLANGQGKLRANRLGYARPRVEWRLVFLSTGEIGLAEHVEQAGRRSRAGQEVRLLDLPADAGAGLGVFEELHGHGSGALFSKVLEHAACSYYGTAGPAFVQKIIDDRDTVIDIVKELQKQFAREHVPADASGQAHRAAVRFGLVGAAGEIASHFGVTAWPEGAALQAAEACFQAWLQVRGGAGDLEEMDAASGAPLH